MKVLLQRVSQASVTVENNIVGQINQGILVFIGVEKGDTLAQAQRLAERVVGYRIFEDEQGKTNLNVRNVEGEILVVSQFTLAADTKKGTRPSFSGAAEPQWANELYLEFVAAIKKQGITTQTGTFRADMKVALVNDGPVTLWLEA
ncbi:D-aminoacyl-tRNA deacylase [Algibacillus agarilyticus]|uniref:D-aminoacyl-tRNA deacylase n=1 Tax=Algibacillus agarilyticus TaxID=2234133 RepID=UPI000DD0D887|nr:D-aminoacyl-tRNA deacylase [Algibacillus agarilyticus]